MLRKLIFERGLNRGGFKVNMNADLIEVGGKSAGVSWGLTLNISF